MFLHKILKLNLRSIFYNFYLFPFKQAIKLPLLISRRTRIKIPGGGIRLIGDIFPGMVQIGFGDVGTVDTWSDRTIVEIEKGGCLICTGRTYFGTGSRIVIGKEGKIKCKGDFTTTARSSFICFKEMIFGKKVLISWDCLFMDTDFHKLIINNQIVNQPEIISIGDNVWIGCRSTVLKGTFIPNGSVVAAGSLLNKKYTKENAIYAGVPGKPVCEDILWDK